MKHIIEKTEKGLSIKNPIPVLIDHDYNKVIGKCNVYYDENGNMIAELSNLLYDVNGLVPSIGYYNGKLLSVGLSASPNIDESIEPIKL